MIGLITTVGAFAITVRQLIGDLKGVGAEFEDIVGQLNHTKSALAQLDSLYRRSTLPAPAISEQAHQIQQCQETLNDIKTNLGSIRGNLNSSSLIRQFLQRKDLMDRDLRRITNQLSNLNSNLNLIATFQVINTLIYAHNKTESSAHQPGNGQMRPGTPTAEQTKVAINLKYAEVAMRYQRDYVIARERSHEACTSVRRVELER